MAVGKKAVFFTLSSIFIVTLFLMYALSQTEVSVEERTAVSQVKVAALNDFAKTFEGVYLERILFASSHSALYALAQKTDNASKLGNPDAFSDDIKKDFRNVVMNGSMLDAAGEELYALNDANKPLGIDTMHNNTLLFWINLTKNMTNHTYNADLSYNISSVDIDMLDAFTINVTIWVNYNITTPTNISSWRRNVSISTNFSIEGMIDPYILANSDPNDRYERRIVKFPKEQAAYSVDDIKEIIGQGYYIASKGNGPSFLQRFEKEDTWKGTNSPYAVESLINPTIPNMAFGSNTASHVDWQYWSGDCRGQFADGQELAMVNEISTGPTTPYPEFRIDKLHADTIFVLGPAEIAPLSETC